MASKNFMIPTPAQRFSSVEQQQQELLYRGPAMAQLNILRQQMQLGRLTIGNRKVTLRDGTVIECNICFNHEYVRVILPPVAPVDESLETPYRPSFVIVPRDGDLLTYGINNHIYEKQADGWIKDSENNIFVLKRDDIFPLFSDHNDKALCGATNGLSMFSDVVTGNSFCIDLYGNGHCISWYSPPNRHTSLFCTDDNDGCVTGYSCEASIPSGFRFDILTEGTIGKSPKAAYGLLPNHIVLYAVIENDLVTLLSQTTGEDKTPLLVISTARYGKAIGEQDWTEVCVIAHGAYVKPWFYDQDAKEFWSTDGDVIFSDEPDSWKIVDYEKSYLAVTPRSAVGSSSLDMSGDATYLYESRSANVLVSTQYSGSSEVIARSDNTYSTKRYTVSDALPDKLQITRNSSGVFLANPVNTDGIPWYCGPCKATITWGGPVRALPDGGAILETECYPPGTWNVTISATYKCGTIEVSGSVDLTINGSAGKWCMPSCLCAHNSLTGGLTTSECYTVVEDGYDRCVAAGVFSYSTVVYPSGTYSVQNKNKLTIYYASSSRQTKTSACPCACDKVQGTVSGFLNGTVTNTLTNSYTQGYYSDASGNITCNPTYMKNRCTIVSTTEYLSEIPFSEYTWCCL